MTDDDGITTHEIVAQLIAACERHLTPSEVLFVRALLITRRDQMIVHMNAAQHGSYTDAGMAALALKCAERIAGGGSN